LVCLSVRKPGSHVRRGYFILGLLCFLATSFAPGQSSDEEQRLKQLFLKSRQEMQIVPSPTPTPKATPVPATPARRPFHSRAKESETPLDRSDEESEERSERAVETPKQTPKPTPMQTPVPAPTEKVEEVPARPAVTPQEESLAEPTPKKKHRGWFFFHFHSDGDEIVIQKSGSQNETVPVGHYNGRWRYLTPAVRRAIDDARVARNRWKYIVVHNSGTRQGNARIFDYYHRHVRRMPNGLAYHFVIGNGTSSGDGQIEIGNRWVIQLAGGHVHSDYLNYISIGICLVGDFNRDLPTRAQYEALDELTRYLRQRVGKVDGRYSIVLGHKEINPRPTDCPGNRFPLNWLHRTFPNN
jgi:N-acetylmuramoyl-L-alanine amidase-like protein